MKYELASSTWGSEEIIALNKVVESGKFTMGNEVRRFEDEFARAVNSDFSVMFNSGSSANLALLASLRYLNEPLFNPGDEIIVPAVSWSTTYYPVHQLGGVLRFIDVDPLTLNIDPSKIEEAITEKTKGIFVVNLLGNPAPWDEINRIAKEHNLFLIEDNCESLGAELNGKSTGTFGIGGTFSTFFSHHISTMEGGLVATDSEELYQTLKSIRAHGWTRDLPKENFVHPKTGSDWDDLFRFVLPGYNLRPLEIEAAIGCEQIKKLPDFVSARRANALLFQAAMADLPDIEIQSENGKSSWFGFSLLLDGPLSGKRGLLVQALNKADIESRPIVAGNFALNPVMKHLRHDPIPELSNADDIHHNGLFVGNHHFPMEKQIERLADVLETFEETYG
jgi:CDP-6-deoxy-D-xylo-4-hexulose-3-dehydrase